MRGNNVSNFGKWADAGVPHKGWTCVDIEDLGSASQICEMCEHQTIRFVHFMTHPNCTGELSCGCDCAARMEENYQAAEIRDKGMRNRAGRKKKWPNLQAWHTSQNGNLTIKKDGFRITVFKKGTEYKAVVSDSSETFKKFTRRAYPDEKSAQLASFEIFITAIEKGAEN